VRLRPHFTSNLTLTYVNDSDEGYDNSYLLHIPFFAGGGVGTSFDWNYTVVNQVVLSGPA
jgi:hypothetical protein